MNFVSTIDFISTRFPLVPVTFPLMLVKVKFLAVWHLAANSQIQYKKNSCEFWGGFVVLFFQEKRPEKITQKSPAECTRDFVRKSSPWIIAEVLS